MSREHVSVSELLHSLDSAELQEVEQVRATLNQQLNTDRGGAVVSSLVEYYLDSLSSQAIVLLSSIREHHHKTLLEKLNDSLSRPGSRLAVLILLGHLIRKQPPWVHHISRSPLLTTLLRCLKTDTDVVVLITAVLVLITLLPMIPQAGKQHIYDFFDVFGRLASWSYKNPGHDPVVYLVHLHAGVYSLFHRLYGMFPCTFISYLRLHYSMKENLDTFQEVVKPMLEQVRVHPELVTGSQDYELEPTRWRCYEVHDIVIECSRLSLDPLESSCEDDLFCHTEPPLSSPKPPPLTSPLPQLNLISGSSVCPPSGCQLTNNLLIQADDVTWSPSSHCGLSTPPPELAATPTCCSVPPLCRITSPSAAAPVTSLTENIYDGRLTPDNSNQVRTGQQVNVQSEKARGQSDVINNSSKEVTTQLLHRTSTPLRDPDLSGTAIHPPSCSVSLCFSPRSRTTEMEVQSPVPPYDALFELALPQAAALFIRKKTKEVLERAAGEREKEGGGEEDEQTFISPLEVLDQLIVHGHSAHEGLSRRLSAVNKSVDRSHFGGKQQSMKSKGPPQGEELQSLKSQLLLVHSQLQYERFKRQQHAVRNRRLLRRVINATALEEQGVAMRAQLSVQDDEIRCLKLSLEEEQRRSTQLQQETHTRGEQLLTHVQQLLQERQDEHRDLQILQSELQECRSRLQDLEIELQKANNKADNAEQQLNQLSLKLCSSEQLQQQIFLLNQQLILLRETNRGLTELLDGGDRHHCTESTMLQCSVGNEYQQLKDSDAQHRQKLEATHHRIAELENQLAWKEQLILDQKKLLEDTSIQSRAELAACESRCSALSLLCRTLQTEMLQLYSQIHLDCRSNGSGASPALHGGCISQTSSSVGIKNGGVKVSTSPLHLASCSSSPLSLSPSPIESPLAVGSFLEKRARELFGPTNQSQEEESPRGGEEEEAAQRETTPPLQEAEDSLLLTGSPPPEPQKQTETTVPPAELMPISQNRRQELTIMDYNESTPTTPAF